MFAKGNATEALDLFKLPKYPGSSLILIGASNTIDLIVKLNEQYKISSDIKNIVFQPYTYDEIFSILKDRVYSTEGYEKHGQIFDEFGLNYCARKIYQIKGGDIRCVLDIVKKAYVEKANSSSMETKSEKIEFDDMVKVFDEFYGKKSSEIIKTLTQQQQTGLVAVYLHLKKNSNVSLTKGEFLSLYNRVADAVFLPRIDAMSLDEILLSYESYEIIKVKSNKKGNPTPSKTPKKTPNKNLNEEIIPSINAEQIKTAFKDDEFFSKFFEE